MASDKALPRRKFIVSAEITISVSTEVLAHTAEAALRIARGRPVMSLCHQCATGESDAEWTTTGELDGEPVDLRVEEA